MIREQRTQRVRLVSPATGQPVAERTFLGPHPRACARSEGPVFLEQDEFTLQGDEVSFDNDIKTWLGGFVRR